MIRVVCVVTLLTLLVPRAASAQAAATASSSAQSSSDVEQRVNSILGRMTLEEKIDMLGGVRDFYIRENKRLGLPALKMADGPVGVRNYGPSTTMPGGIGFAATWDPALVQQAARAIADDARARGVHFLLGPGVNIYRAPMCGRNFEYFGEDPYLASQTVVSYVQGVQSRGVIATVKHYMGNNSEYDRHNIDSEIDERTMREIYLPVFEAAVKQGKVGAIMDSYNLVNGEHATQNGFLNTEIAKKDWGFPGIVMSDWSATYDGVAAANGGLDLEMPSGKFMNRETLLPAVQSGKVTQATIDDKIRRILREAILFGFLDRDQTDHSVSLQNPAGDAMALQAARESIVLLKNDGNLLPLDKNSVHTVAIIGPDANPADPDGGGSAHVVPFHAVSYLDGITSYLGSSGKVQYDRGLKTYPEIANQTEFITDDGKPGLLGEYFDNAKLEGTAKQSRVDRHINVGGEDYNGNSKEVSMRWTGNYVAQNGGPHEFFVRGPGGNGGFRLYVDDKLVVDNWDRATALLNFASIPLDAGSKHKVRLEYFRHSDWGPSRLAFGVLDPSQAVNADAKAIASKADVAIVFIGFDSTIESEGADRTFRLPPGQDALVREIMAANKKTIVVLTAGGGADMSAWVDEVPALLHGWYSGQEGGTAMAQLLFGDYSPSGRLPITLERRIEDNAAFNSYYPNDGPKRVKYSEGVFVGYRHFDRDNIKPLFPFGHGLTYSTFEYKNLSVPASGRSDQPVTVTFDVTNTGSRPAAEVAQLYVGEPHASVPRPVKELKGFSRVELKPGETRHVSIALDQRAFSYYDVAGKNWKADPGEFAIYVGRSAGDIQLTGKINLQ